MLGVVCVVDTGGEIAYATWPPAGVCVRQRQT